MQIAGKKCLVTGGASGIGLAVADAFLQNGAEVIIVADCNCENGKKAVEMLTGKFGENRVLFIETDVSKSYDLENLYSLIAEKFTKIDIVVNNAGVLHEASWSQEIAVNFIGLVQSTKLALNYLRPGSVIVNMSSIMGIKAVGCFPVYSATKQAVITFTSTMAKMPEKHHAGIRFVTVCPGLTETALGLNCFRDESPEMVAFIQQGLQMLSIQKPEAVASAIVHVIETDAETGSIWVCEGGRPPYEIEQLDREQLRKQLPSK